MTGAKGLGGGLVFGKKKIPIRNPIIFQKRAKKKGGERGQLDITDALIIIRKLQMQMRQHAVKKAKLFHRSDS